MNVRKAIIRNLPPQAQAHAAVRRHFVAKVCERLKITPDRKVSEIPQTTMIQLTTMLHMEIAALYRVG